MACCPAPLAVSCCWTLVTLITAAVADDLTPLASIPPNNPQRLTTLTPYRPQGVTRAPPNPYLFSPLPGTGGGVTHAIPADPHTNASLVSGTYLLSVPEVAIPGFNFTLGFESFGGKPYNLKARIFEQVYYRLGGTGHYKIVEVVSTYAVFTKGYPGVLDLPIPDNLRSQTVHYWEVSCVHDSPDCPWHTLDYNGDSVFSSVSSSVHAISDVTTIFVQTDKAIYKPGQLETCDVILP